MKTRVLITAFDAFGGESINSANEAVAQLNFKINNVEIFKLFVPTVFKKSSEAVIEAIEKIKPHCVLCIGEAGGRECITPERVAINVEDARIKDNEGNQPQDKPIVSEAPAAYFSTLPIKSIVEELKRLCIKAEISNTAGTFVCNHLFYSVMHHISEKKLGTLAGFIHVPYLPEQANKKGLPSMTLDEIIIALETAITETIKATPMPL